MSLPYVCAWCGERVDPAENPLGARWEPFCMERCAATFGLTLRRANATTSYDRYRDPKVPHASSSIVRLYFAGATRTHCARCQHDAYYIELGNLTSYFCPNCKKLYDTLPTGDVIQGRDDWKVLDVRLQAKRNALEEALARREEEG